MRFKTTFKVNPLKRPYYSVGEYLEEKAKLKRDNNGASALLIGLNQVSSILKKMIFT